MIRPVTYASSRAQGFSFISSVHNTPHPQLFRYFDFSGSDAEQMEKESDKILQISSGDQLLSSEESCAEIDASDARNRDGAVCQPPW